MFCRSCSSVLFQRRNPTMFSPTLLSFVWLALFSFNSCWLYSVVPFCRVVDCIVVYICSVYLVVRLLFSCARLLTVSSCLDGYACWQYSVVLLHSVVDSIQFSSCVQLLTVFSSPVVYSCWQYSVVPPCTVGIFEQLQTDKKDLTCHCQLAALFSSFPSFQNTKQPHLQK